MLFYTGLTAVTLFVADALDLPSRGIKAYDSIKQYVFERKVEAPQTLDRYFAGMPEGQQERMLAGYLVGHPSLIEGLTENDSLDKRLGSHYQDMRFAEDKVGYVLDGRLSPTERVALVDSLYHRMGGQERLQVVKDIIGF